MHAPAERSRRSNAEGGEEAAEDGGLSSGDNKIKNLSVSEIEFEIRQTRKAVCEELKLTLARQAGKMTNRSGFTDCNTIRPSHTYALKERERVKGGEGRGV